ncbi:MAG: phytoene/squalene synthase family protein [Bacteroidales bacterium]|nr:phytoene/squalene synthase family protein [Bacteroidales bacterium]
MELFATTSFEISRLITQNYSTSFSMATRMFGREVREAIYSIYGFVRLADEIVDSFHGFDKKNLLQKFESDYYEACRENISTNPVLYAFQLTVKKYGISDLYVQAFLQSMKFDLEKSSYGSKSEMNEYIYGSADVVGLMCLRVFCNGNEKLFKELEIPAMKLGSAFQKVNFLRDLKNDIESLGRNYFPEIGDNMLNENIKQKIITEIESDFSIARQGITKLPGRSKFAVLIAYYYYKRLLEKIKLTPAGTILETRVRVSNIRKLALLLKATFVYKLRLV